MRKSFIILPYYRDHTGTMKINIKKRIANLKIKILEVYQWQSKKGYILFILTLMMNIKSWIGLVVFIRN